MKLRRVPSKEIRQIVLSRIISGEYPIGKLMPALRRLALDLGANRDTISKVQQLESQGIPRQVPGCGGAVIQQLAAEPGHTAQRFARLARELIWSGLAMGLSHARIHEQPQRAVDEVHRRSALRLMSLECTLQDARSAIDITSRVVAQQRHQI